MNSKSTATGLKTWKDFMFEVGDSLTLAFKLKVRQTTVESWERIGIPQKYWENICIICNNHKIVNVTNLHKLNESLKKVSEK